MKTSSKQLNNVGLLLVFLACISFGYAIAKQIWGRETFELALIVSGITCLFFALAAFRLAKRYVQDKKPHDI
jgi:predicted permease